MKRRIIVGGALAAVFATLIVFELLPAPEERATAMERMAEKISQATSYRMKLVWRLNYPAGGPDGPPFAVVQMEAQVYWKAPRTTRVDVVSREYSSWEDMFEPEAGNRETNITVTDKPGIRIVHGRPGSGSTEWYYVTPALSGSAAAPDEHELIQELGRYRQKADRQLGTKTVDGRTLVGFEIDAKKVDPDYFPGSIVVWLDESTNLPVQIYENYPEAMPAQSIQMTNIEWNVELDDSLFDTTPPKGYEDKTPAPPSVADQIENVTKALRFYAELSGGHYPRVRKIHNDYLLQQMLKMAGLTYPPSPEQLQDEELKKRIDRVYAESVGFGTLQAILNNNRDAVWNGLTVAPQDADKILIHWKRSEGGYQVIYGDLRSETVSSEGLRELERR